MLIVQAPELRLQVNRIGIHWCHDIPKRFPAVVLGKRLLVNSLPTSGRFLRFVATVYRSMQRKQAENTRLDDHRLINWLGLAI